jgi:hypothetical protein
MLDSFECCLIPLSHKSFDEWIYQEKSGLFWPSQFTDYKKRILLEIEEIYNICKSNTFWFGDNMCIRHHIFEHSDPLPYNGLILDVTKLREVRINQLLK